MNKKEKLGWIDYFYLVLAVTTLVTIIYNVIGMFTKGKGSAEFNRHSSNTFEAIGALVLMIIPMVLRRVYKKRIPVGFEAIIGVLIFCGMVLGDCWDFYAIFPQFDSILQAGFGYLLAYFGLLLTLWLNKGLIKEGKQLNKIYVVFFCLGLAAFIGSAWELFEFLYDELCGVNSQQFMATTRGTYYTDADIPLMGHDALRDTMKDIALDLLGGLFVALNVFFEKMPTEEPELKEEPAAA